MLAKKSPLFRKKAGSLAICGKLLKVGEHITVSAEAAASDPLLQQSVKSGSVTTRKAKNNKVQILRRR